MSIAKLDSTDGPDAAPADLLTTWVEATFRPASFFSRPPPRRSTCGPVLFAILVSTCAGVAGSITNSILAGGGGEGIAPALGAVVWAPLWSVFSLYVSAGLLHGVLKLIGAGGSGGLPPAGETSGRSERSGERPAGSMKPFDPPANLEGPEAGRSVPFNETVQCVGYASAPALFGVLGLPGAVIGGIWSIVVLCIAVIRVHRSTAARAVLGTAGVFAAPVLLALGLRVGVVEAFKIPSGAMSPTLVPGDHVFVSKLAYGPMLPWSELRMWSSLPPRRGDVMVFKFPENKQQDFIKRNIAIPGDTLEVIDGRPIINGWLVPHCYVGPMNIDGHKVSLYVEHLDEMSYFTIFESKPDDRACATADDCRAGSICKAGVCGSVLQGPFNVRDGEVWVMGDNRNNSHDSRSWRGGLGAGVPYENIKGRAKLIWISFDQQGGIASERQLIDVMGRPGLPPSSPPALRTKLEECLRERPAATPPPRSARTLP